MNGLRLLTLEEKNALAVLADAFDRCREEDMRTTEVLASSDSCGDEAGRSQIF
jgi:hypothetical protein